MWTQIKTALFLLLTLTVISGVLYPLAVTGMAQVVFSRQADGSLILRNGQPVGSALIGQPFDDPKYFWGRLSATSPYPYNSAASSGSNLGPTNEALLKSAQDRMAVLKAADPENSPPVPVDLVTASGSGLDPNISPAAAEYQIHRVAKARGLDDAKVRALVSAHTEGRQFGVLGEPRVHVLRLNLALDHLR
jgi:potassium-transporting ATPase KdpC subunit